MIIQRPLFRNNSSHQDGDPVTPFPAVALPTSARSTMAKAKQTSAQISLYRSQGTYPPLPPATSLPTSARSTMEKTTQTTAKIPLHHSHSASPTLPPATSSSTSARSTMEQATQTKPKVTLHRSPGDCITYRSKQREEIGFEKFQALIRENTIAEPRALIIPQRRVCGFEEDDVSVSFLEKVKRAVFITKEEIVKIHPMRFLRNSPFVQQIPQEMAGEPMWYHTLDENDPGWTSICDDMVHKKLHAIGRTRSGRHVILQQAIKSCVPSCIAMLLLDHGKTPDYRAIQVTNLANERRAIRWVQKAGLEPKITPITSPQEAAEFLPKLLKNHGPGVLGINHPKISGHVIVLDAISRRHDMAMIRDSFHGWAVTMRLSSLLPWIDQDSYFLQII
jgi:hypothetical protein